MEDDFLLIEKCKRNNSSAFEILYKKYAPTMKGVAFRYVNDSSIAEDIIQEAFIKVFVNINSFNSKSGSFEGWLRRVVVNASIDQFKKIKKQNESIYDIDYLTENDEDSEPNDNYDYSKEELIESINMLPKGYKLVFNMYVFDKYSHKEIASSLNITEGTSKSQFSKAKKYLKNILEKQKTFINGK